ncbi:MAG: hypothetical protein H6568_10910 [Lewinellaceae bacterium]|nr:hypothetical protein [Lewinellaceae bacterium]
MMYPFGHRLNPEEENIDHQIGSIQTAQDMQNERELNREGQGDDPLSEAFLSARELEVLALLALGLTSDEIGRKLYIEASTVNTHRRKMIRRAGARNTTHLVFVACQRGWIPL